MNTDPRYLRETHNIDLAWDRALSLNPSAVARVCQEVCAEYELDFVGDVTWEQLAPLYGMEGR